MAQGTTKGVPIDVDSALTANSDLLVPSQKAIKSYVDTNFLNPSDLSATTPLTYSSSTGVFTINQASGSSNGYLSSTDWSTFNSKQDTITLTTTGTSGAATLLGSTLNIPNYATSASKSFMSVLQGATVAASTTTFGIWGTTGFNAAERARVFVVPHACTVSKMYVRIFAAQSATGSLVFTIRKNTADTTVIATIAAGSALDTEANSGVTSTTFVAGDDMSIKVVNSATATSATIHNISIMVEI